LGQISVLMLDCGAVEYYIILPLVVVFSSFLKKSEFGWLAGALRLRNWEEIETSSFLQSIL
jgi:hypothetical protein